MRFSAILTCWVAFAGASYDFHSRTARIRRTCSRSFFTRHFFAGKKMGGRKSEEKAADEFRQSNRRNRISECHSSPSLVPLPVQSANGTAKRVHVSPRRELKLSHRPHDAANRKPNFPFRLHVSPQCVRRARECRHRGRFASPRARRARPGTTRRRARTLGGRANPRTPSGDKAAGVITSHNAASSACKKRGHDPRRCAIRFWKNGNTEGK